MLWKCEKKSFCVGQEVVPAARVGSDGRVSPEDSVQSIYSQLEGGAFLDIVYFAARSDTICWPT